MKRDKYIDAMLEQQNKEIQEEEAKELARLRELTKYKRPSVAASIIIKDLSTGKYLLIKRGNEPFKGYHCFPGGFMDVDQECVEETAIRELKEETSIRIEKRDLYHIDIRSNPDRDPREHILDIGFYAEIFHAAEKATAGDDAAEVHWATENAIDEMDLAFDHNLYWKHFKESNKYISEVVHEINNNPVLYN